MITAITIVAVGAYLVTGFTTYELEVRKDRGSFAKVDHQFISGLKGVVWPVWWSLAVPYKVGKGLADFIEKKSRPQLPEARIVEE